MRFRFTIRSLLIATTFVAVCLVVCWPALRKQWLVNSVTRHLGDSNRKVRTAAQALSDWGDHSIPALIELLQHDDLYVRIVAAESLGKLGPDAVAAVPDLTIALSDENFRVRYAAAHTHRSKVLFLCPLRSGSVSEVFIIGDRIGEGSIGSPAPWRVVRVTTDQIEAESLIGPKASATSIR